MESGEVKMELHVKFEKEINYIMELHGLKCLSKEASRLFQIWLACVVLKASFWESFGLQVK